MLKANAIFITQNVYKNLNSKAKQTSKHSTNIVKFLAFWKIKDEPGLVMLNACRNKITTHLNTYTV